MNAPLTFPQEWNRAVIRAERAAQRWVGVTSR